MKRAIVNMVLDNNGKIDIKNLGLAWTWFDDDGNACGTSQLISIRVNDGKCLVEFDDRVEPLENLDYVDFLGRNFIECLYNCLTLFLPNIAFFTK